MGPRYTTAIGLSWFLFLAGLSWYTARPAHGQDVSYDATNPDRNPHWTTVHGYAQADRDENSQTYTVTLFAQAHALDPQNNSVSAIKIEFEGINVKETNYSPPVSRAPMYGYLQVTLPEPFPANSGYKSFIVHSNVPEPGKWGRYPQLYRYWFYIPSEPLPGINIITGPPYDTQYPPGYGGNPGFTDPNSNNGYSNPEGLFTPSQGAADNLKQRLQSLLDLPPWGPIRDAAEAPNLAAPGGGSLYGYQTLEIPSYGEEFGRAEVGSPLSYDTTLTLRDSGSDQDGIGYGNAHTTTEWAAGVRKVLQLLLWGTFLVALVQWGKGKVTA